MADNAQTVSIATKYGPLTARFFAGPDRAPGDTTAHDGKYPASAHAFGRDPEPAYVGAVVETGDYGRLADLTINGIAYRSSERYTLTPRGWQREPGTWPLQRANAFSDDGVTDGARKAHREVIVPAILAALEAADAEVAATRKYAREVMVANTLARANALRAEAARLDAMVTDGPESFGDVFARVLSVLPDATVGDDNDGQIVFYSGLRLAADDTVVAFEAQS